MATDAVTGQPIFHGSTRSGLRNVGSYQVSGHPYITGSTIAANQQHTISFPYVTKSITVTASGSITGEIRAHFVSTGSGGDNDRITAGHHYISFDSHEDSMEFDVKCKEMFISTTGSSSGGYKVYASLTTIQTGSMFVITGSGATD
jgi:hypothetical protein